jgi:hypothetical protein
MKPSQLASQLRRIAAAIDNSKNPDRNLISRDLKKVLYTISSPIQQGAERKPSLSEVKAMLIGLEPDHGGYGSDFSFKKIPDGVRVTLTQEWAPRYEEPGSKDVIGIVGDELRIRLNQPEDYSGRDLWSPKELARLMGEYGS